MPTRTELESHKWLRFLHRHMHHEFLWRFDQKGMAKAAMIGLFMCMMPMPFQMIPAAVLALFLRANLIIAVALVWVSNPVTMLPMLYGAYLFGCWLLGQTPILHDSDIVWHEIYLHLHTIFLPLMLGCVLIGLLSGMIVAVIIWLTFELVHYFKRP